MNLIEEYKDSNSLDLLEYISWKNEYPEEAKASFHLFCFRFNDFVLKKSEILCSHWNKNEVIALDIAKCTMARVWKYPTYNHSKSNAEDVDKGIKIWLAKIISTQLTNYHNKGTCFEPDNETDLSLIYTFDEFLEKSGISSSKKEELVEKFKIVEQALSQLTEKHKIIYLTYKMYTHTGNNIPRVVSKKLQDELELATGSIRKYKEQANKQVEYHLKQYHGE